MKLLLPALLGGLLAAGSLLPREDRSPTAPPSLEQPPEKKEGSQDMAEMMEKMKRWTTPGAQHEALKRFLGDWTTETRMFMVGQPTPPEKGQASFSWLMPGRWLKGEGEGRLMGRPLSSFLILGYDNFKMSYVVTMVNDMDTAMLRAEGDLTPSGQALLAYGTLDEYLTGERDKMVKYVWRFEGDDKFILEVHDLAIGERNTKVVEVVYTRRK